MLSAIFLINSKGEIVIYRLYRDDISLAAANQFRMQVRGCCIFRRACIFPVVQRTTIRPSNTCSCVPSIAPLLLI